MYTSRHYTCEQIDQRLLQGYYDDCVAAGYTGTLEQFQGELLAALGISANGLDAGDVNILPGTGLEASKLQAALTEIVNNNLNTNQALAQTNQNFNDYKDEVANKYGDYQDVSEFIAITTDANDKIIEGIKKDGTKVFTGDVDAPNIRQLGTDVTQAKSQAQDATAAALLATEQVEGMAGDVTQAKSQAQQAAQDTQQLSQDVVEKYGDYQDVSEFVEMKTDSQDRIIEGTRRDGTKVFMGDVDAPNIREMNQSVEEAKASTEWFNKDNSEEWAEITTDSQGRIIKGIKAEGTVYVYKLDCPELDTTITKKIIEIVGNIDKLTELKNSTFLPDEIRYRQGDASIPELTRVVEGVETPVTLTPVEVNSQDEFDNVMGLGLPFIDDISPLVVGKYINKLGVIIDTEEASNFFYSKPIKAHKNSEYIFTATGHEDNIAVISECDFDGTDITNIVPKVISIDSTERVYTYTPSSDCYLLVSAENVGTPSLKHNLPKITGTDVLLNLNCDVIVSAGISIPSYRTVAINGNGHRMIGCDAEHNAVTIQGNYCQCPYEGSLTGLNLFIAPNGEVLRLARSPFYTAASEIIAADNVLDKNGNIAYTTGTKFPRANQAFSGDFNSSTVYPCRFKLPPELQDLEISSTDNVYINLTSDWLSVQTKVTKTEKINNVNWLFFDYTSNSCGYGNYIGINNDYHVGNIYTSFFLINYKMEDYHSALIKPVIENNEVVGQTLIFPSKYTKVYESNTPMFNLDLEVSGVSQPHRGVYLKVTNAELVATQIIKTGEQSPLCRLIVNNCTIHGCVYNAIDIRKNSHCYFFNNEAYDCELGVVTGQYTVQDTMLVAVGNTIHDVGKRRLNSYAIQMTLNHYIAYNTIYDFGYSAINVGVTNMPKGNYKNSSGIVEHNIVYQTPEYFRNALHHVPMDAGALYIPTHHKESIIRHNTIYNYTGRYGNKGIYCDAGCYNMYIYSNIIANTPNTYAISARLVHEKPYDPDGGEPHPDNINKYILQNYCENGIWIGGSDEETPNGCHLGYNLINKRMQTIANKIQLVDIECQEPQMLIDIPSYQGAFSTSLDIEKWLNYF